MGRQRERESHAGKGHAMQDSNWGSEDRSLYK